MTYIHKRPSTKVASLQKSNVAIARRTWPEEMDGRAIEALRDLTSRHQFSVVAGDVRYLNSAWYVTHAGLVRLAYRKHCAGIHTAPVNRFCDVLQKRWVFRATIQIRKRGSIFLGYGDAEPSNVSNSVRGCEMRIAETRAVNRALRKAYGIGICSVEELGSSAVASNPVNATIPAKGANGNGYFGGPRLRDRLCQLIRQHRLGANLVKAYAVDFCGTTTLREATREQVEAFVAHLSDWAEKDRNALLCQLNSYLPPQTETTEAGAA